MIEPERTLLWSATTPQASNTNIVLEDSIDNYDEIMIYASAANTFNRYPIMVFPVVSGKLNINGPLYFGKWGTGDNWLLANGTRMGLSGNSGTVQSSYYFGKNNGSTAWAAAYQNNRTSDVRPLRIYGLKYPKNYDMTLIWETTGNPYNTNITLNESVNHFDEIMVYGSGNENDANGWKTTKNIYQSQNRLMGIEPWGYTPWGIGQKYNYILGCEAMISGNSGHIGSSWCFGMANSTAYGGYRWTGAEAPKMMVPWKIYGLKRRPTYNFKSIPTDGGSVSSNINPGYSGDIATITVIPNGDEWKVSAIDVSGATLTGNEFMYENTNVSAKAEFEHSKDLTLVPNVHATLSADKMSGFSGDVVTVDATTDEGWYFTGLNVTGAVATGNKFMFIGENVTAEGLYTDEGYPITYENDGHGTLTGDTDIFIPGSDGVQLSTSYNTYYRFSGYEVTGGYIENGKLYPTAACTAKAVYKVNAFTATGIFDWTGEKSAATRNYGNLNVNVNGILKAFTGSKPSNWPATNGAWNVTNASAYGISAKAALSGYFGNSPAAATARLGISIGGSMKTSGQWTKAGSNYYPSITVTLNKNTTQGQIRCSSYANTTYSAASYKAKLTTNTWSATGYAP